MKKIDNQKSIMIFNQAKYRSDLKSHFCSFTSHFCMKLRLFLSLFYVLPKVFMHNLNCVETGDVIYTSIFA